MSDFNIQVKVRNGRLLRAIRAKYGTAAEMSRKSGVDAQHISDFVNFRRSPILQNGNWSNYAFDVSSALHCEPEDLWPEQLVRIAIKRNTSEIDASVEQIAVDGPERMNLIQDDVRRFIRECNLSPRDKFVLEQRFFESQTLIELGKAMDISGPRVRQIERKALMSIKHSKSDRMKFLNLLEKTNG